MSFTIRSGLDSDLEDAERVARIAFDEYIPEFPEWIPVLESGPMAKLAAEGELLVAEKDGAIVGTVAYFGPGLVRNEFFQPDWSVARMMAVDPAHRGHGVARALVDECAKRARRDKARALALFTSPAMKTAVELYKRAGFERRFGTPPFIGMPCDVYTLDLDARP